MMKYTITLYILITCCFSFINPTQTNTNPQTLLKSTVIGCAGSAAAMTIYEPFDYLHNRMVQKKTISFNLLQMYRGLPANTLGKSASFGLLNGSYAGITSLMSPNNSNELSTKQKLIAATSSAALSGTVSSIGQLISLHQQNDGNAIGKTIKNFPHTYSSLKIGMPTVMLQEAVAFNGIKVISPYIEKKISALSGKNSTLTSLFAFALTGGFVAFTTQPIYLVATKLHADVKQENYTSLIGTIKKIIKENGLKGFYIERHPLENEKIRYKIPPFAYRCLGTMPAIAAYLYIEKTLTNL